MTEMETKMNELDERVAELAARYRPLAAEILKEVVRIPADYVDRPRSAGGDPSCGLSNHEKPRLEYLKKKIVEAGAVRRPEDVGYDGYGNLVWTVDDPGDGVSAKDKRVVYFDGHTDTVNALRPAWRAKGSFLISIRLPCSSAGGRSTRSPCPSPIPTCRSD